MPLRPTFDFLAELQLVTDLPVLVGVDGWNLMRGMATSQHWQKATPLHASELLVPSMLGTLDYGAGMANGVRQAILSFLWPKRTQTAGALPSGVGGPSILKTRRLCGPSPRPLTRPPAARARQNASRPLGQG